MNFPASLDGNGWLPIHNIVLVSLSVPLTRTWLTSRTGNRRLAHTAWHIGERVGIVERLELQSLCSFAVRFIETTGDNIWQLWPPPAFVGEKGLECWWEKRCTACDDT